MKRLKLLGVTLVAMCAMGLMATSAFALPDISITLCGVGVANCTNYPLHLNYLSNTVKTKLEGLANVLSGEGLHILLLIGLLTDLGTFRAIFLKVEKAGVEKCFNQGVEANGEVLTEGTFSVVYTSLAGSTQGLQLGELFLPKELTGATEILCPTNTNKVKVKGDVISSINGQGATSNTQITGVKGSLAGSGGHATIKTFWNDAGVALLAKLESNVDNSSFKESNQVVEGEPELTALEAKMFVITSR